MKRSDFGLILDKIKTAIELADKWKDVGMTDDLYNAIFSNNNISDEDAQHMESLMDELLYKIALSQVELTDISGMCQIHRLLGDKTSTDE